MSKAVLLDTDILSAAMRHDPRVLPQVTAYLSEHEQLTFSLITRFEILRGLKSKGATVQLSGFQSLCSKSNILPLTTEIVDAASDVYAGLRKSGSLITDADILIAATAIVNGLPLVTNNTRHFGRIPGIQLFNWIA